MDLPLLEAAVAGGNYEAINNAYKHYVDLYPTNVLIIILKMSKSYILLVIIVVFLC